MTRTSRSSRPRSTARGADGTTSTRTGADVESVTRIQSVRERVAEWRRAGQGIALVQTMGCLHKGHAALIAEARHRAPRTVVSVFVNPLQFGGDEDFSRYPRTIEHDRALAEEAGADLVFAPTTFEIFPSGFERSTRVDVPELSRILEGQSRPSHFEGAATIATKFLQIIQPDVAVLGEKDYQHLVIVRRLVADLCMPVEVVAVPVVRDHDGLAYGARNRLLLPRERNLAPRLYEALKHARRRLGEGERDFAALQEQGLREVERAGLVPDYFSIRQAGDLLPPRFETREVVVLAAARLGAARLV
ncbi:MAG: pantoate--beta-alanine ligase, partial [Proteobacteria bacterium]|nr:pantoate--beta-alanine ligase [Pseudomonadota bacterium]